MNEISLYNLNWFDDRYYGAYRTLYIFPCFCFFLLKKVGKLNEF